MYTSLRQLDRHFPPAGAALSSFAESHAVISVHWLPDPAAPGAALVQVQDGPARLVRRGGRLEDIDLGNFGAFLEAITPFGTDPAHLVSVFAFAGFGTPLTARTQLSRHELTVLASFHPPLVNGDVLAFFYERDARIRRIVIDTARLTVSDDEVMAR